LEILEDLVVVGTIAIRLTTKTDKKFGDLIVVSGEVVANSSAHQQQQQPAPPLLAQQ